MSLADLAARFRFEPIPDAQRADHLPASVAAALPLAETLVFPVDDAHSDTQQFSERFGFELADCANTLVLRYTREGAEHHAAVLTLGSRRLDINGAVKKALQAQRISFARREVATELTGMEFGGITAFGLPAELRILIDSAVMDRPFVVVGAGYRRSKILVTPAVLAALPNAQVADMTLPQD